MLVKMTFGLWDDDLASQMDVECLAESFDVNPHDDYDKVTRVTANSCFKSSPQELQASTHVLPLTPSLWTRSRPP